MTKMGVNYVYLVCNFGKSTLYIGVTNDIKRRLSEHYDDSIRSKKSFTGKYNCTNLIYYETYDSINEAIHREKILKKLSRSKKEELICSINPDWEFFDINTL